jgi:hypothetical protein
LYAKSTFFHNTTGADCYLGIENKIKKIILLISIVEMISKVEIVKPPYFIRAVVGAISGSYTPVINHLIQTIRTMSSCHNGTDIFTWGMIAMLAEHNLVIYRGFIGGAGIISINTYPLHFSSSVNLLLTNNRNIIFRSACNYATTASYTFV